MRMARSPLKDVHSTVTIKQHNSTAGWSAGFLSQPSKGPIDDQNIEEPFSKETGLTLEETLVSCAPLPPGYQSN